MTDAPALALRPGTPADLAAVAQFIDGLAEQVLDSQIPWLCASCHGCQVRCPRGIPVSDSMRQIREWVLGEGVQETPRALGTGSAITASAMPWVYRRMALMASSLPGIT